MANTQSHQLKWEKQFPIIPNRQQPPKIQIWTDGSLKDTNLGSGIVFSTVSEHNESTIYQEIKCKPPAGNPSSTKAELAAIYGALIRCTENQQIQLFSDSQAAIDGISKACQISTTIRQICKMNNNAMLDAIKCEIKKFLHPPQFIKINSRK